MQSLIQEKDIKSYSFINKWKECQSFVANVKGKKPLFILVIGSTDTSLIPGISAAGKNIEALKLTPALDADFLISKQDKIPVSPSGVPSPVILSKAIIDVLHLETLIVDVGAYKKPECHHIDLNMGPAKCLTTGEALGPVKNNFLFQKGEKLVSKLQEHDYIIVGECVPGGTTTALSVLCALGIDAFSLVSSSFPEGNQFLKNQTVRDALLEHSHLFSEIKKNPLKACEYFGDPMQPFVTGLIKGAQKANLPVLLAGGSQMLAVYLLAKTILDYSPHDTLVGTTSWVVSDKNSKTKKLAELTGAPLMSSKITFSNTTYKGLSAYEEGHIKEGVGAGGLMVIADLYKELSEKEIVKEIENLYSKVTLKDNP